ncbi:MAG: Holliday junction resolvase RuvX [Phycisphaera sp.]|nr:Holliday junction resolvase RuvX [Phycisphaera sp.]
MRYLAIDPGDKRTGLAVGDDETDQAGPVGVIDSSDDATLLRGIRDAIDEHGPDALVVGVPYGADGFVGPRAKKSLALATLLREATGLEVFAHDETLTSYEADDLMRQSGLTHKQKKARRDALAATAILRDFLTLKGRGDHGQ